MIRYVALLRGINVGGRKLIKMADLARIFSTAGCKNVRTYLAAGNVIFDSGSANKNTLTKKIEKSLKNALGYEVTVVLRTLSELQALISRNPFRMYRGESDVMLCVVFLADEPNASVKIPLVSAPEKLEVFRIADRAAFVVSRRKKNGWFGFPNNFVEKQLDVTGTTRQWSTVVKLLKAAEK